MERPIQKSIGTKLEELDTPSLILNGEAYKTKWRSVSKTLAGNQRTFRSNASVHRTPSLTHFVGEERIYVETLSEALIFAAHGVKDILVGRLPLEDPNSLLQSLITQCSLTICANDLGQAEQLALFRKEKKRDFKILLRIALNPTELGVSVNCYEEYLKEKGGFLPYEGIFFEWSHGNELTESSSLFRLIQDSDDPQEEHWESAIVVAICESESSVPSIPPVTSEIIDGSNIWTLDGSLRKDELLIGVVSAIMSLPIEDQAFIDCGQKAISIDNGLPHLLYKDSLRVDKMSAEHGFLEISKPSNDFGLAERVVLIPSNISDTCNLYDYMNVLSDGVLTSIWKVEARGRYF